MKRSIRLPFQLTAAASLVLSASHALTAEDEAYTPLALQLPGTAVLAAAGNRVELGLSHTSDDNFMFGQYNGLHENGVNLIGNLQWQDFSAEDSYWQVSLSDLGLDTREGLATWARPGRLKFRVGFDSQLQVRNDSGRTPFRGDDRLLLPDNWTSGLSTADWDQLPGSLHGFERELERDKLFAEIEASLNDHWSLDSHLSYESREGTGDIGGAIAPDRSAGDAVLLPLPVDYRTTELDLGLAYRGSALSVEGRVAYSDFDNKNEILTWQNPYSSFGPRVAYPSGTGGLGLAPDNDQRSARLTGVYVLSPYARLQFDGSYALNSQDQDYLEYSANGNLLAPESLPRANLDGEVAVTQFGGKLLLRPLPKLDLNGFYRYRERDYDVPRDGYRYIRGDGQNQPRAALTVYNSARDYESETLGGEASYRLPLRSRLRFEYAFEQIDRKNAAVDHTEEDRYTLGYRIQPWSQFSANIELLYGDRQADTYQWDQSYYALLDTELINATPDNQRYINHPELSQFFLSNREQQEVKLDLSYLPGANWNLALNLLWHEDDYDKSELGLTETDWQRLNLSASYAPGSDISLTVYGGFDRFESEQSSRAFRGGQEKDAFTIYPPLPQASDPGRNWDLDSKDDSFTLGAQLTWQASEALSLALDYSFVDTTAEQRLTTFDDGLVASDLPDVDTTLHHLEAVGSWVVREGLDLQLHYQYYRFKTDDWAREGVQTDTIGKLLTFGDRNANEQIHYVGASVTYHWQ